MHPQPIMSPGMKHCRPCGDTQPLSAFNRCTSAKDGLQARCRACEAAYRDAHRDHKRAVNRTYYATHREEEAARKLVYWAARREQNRTRSRAYYAAHREDRAVYQAAHRRDNPERVAAIEAAYRARNRKRVAASRAAYRIANPDIILDAWQRRYARKKGATVLGRVDYAEIRQRDRGLCWLCGKAVPRHQEEFDHAIALSKHGEHTTRNIRLTHRVCNRRKEARDITHQRFLL